MMRLLNILLLSVLGFFLGLTPLHQVLAESSDQPNLHRGVNLACWLANAPRQTFYARDFNTIKQAGFDFVRLPVNPEFFGFSLHGEEGQTDTMNFHSVDQAILNITQSGLAVVLDIHPGSGFMKTLESDNTAEDKFVELWSALAKRYSDKKIYPNNMLAFEILNEPQYYENAARYNALVAKLTRKIRTIDPTRLVIVEAPAPGKTPVESLNLLMPINDPNVAYDVHYYRPYIITHQGIHMGFEKEQVKFINNLPYPSKLADADHITLTAEGNPVKAKAEVQAYIADNWSRDRMVADLAPAAEWAKRNDARLLILEYGAVRNHIDPASRYRWIADAAAAMNSLNLGWSLWDYADLMGIVSMIGEVSKPDPVDGSVRFVHPETGAREIEPAAIKALGLKTPSSQ